MFQAQKFMYIYLISEIQFSNFRIGWKFQQKSTKLNALFYRS